MTQTVYSKDGEAMVPVVIDKLGPGDFIKRSPDAKAVYLINRRNRKTKTHSANFSCSKWPVLLDDMHSEIFIKADKIVYVGYTTNLAWLSQKYNLFTS